MTTTPQQPEPVSLRRELQVHLDTLKDLGPEYADPLSQSFMDKFEKLVDARIDTRIAQRGGNVPAIGSDQQLKFMATTLALGIPITAIAGGIAEIDGIIAVWIALVLINLVNAFSFGRR
jgi:hypothetical protein